MEKIPLTDEQFTRLVNYLQGSSETLEHALEYLFDLDIDDIPISDNSRLDGVIFSCVDCGWWYEIADMTDDTDHDWCCNECHPNVDED